MSEHKPDGAQPALSAGIGKLDIFSLAMVVMFDTIAFGIMVPILPFLAEAFGASKLEIGLIFALWGGTAFFSGSLWGYLSDRMGRRPMILVSIVLAAIAMLIMGLGNGLWALAVGRGLTGLAAGKFGVVNAYVADVTTPQSRVRVAGIIQSALSLGFVFGPVIGGLLTGGGQEVEDLQRPMLIAAFANVAAFLLCMFVLKEPDRERSTGPRKTLLQNLAILGRTSGSRLPVLVMVMTQATVTSSSFLFPLWGAEILGWGAIENGYNFTWVSLLTVFLQIWLLNKLNKVMGLPTILILGMASFTVLYAVAPHLDSLLPVLVLLSLFAFGLSFTNPVLSTLLANNTAADKQGAVQGAAESLKFLAAVIGPAMVGYVYEDYGLLPAFSVILVFSASGLVAAAFLRQRHKRRVDGRYPDTPLY